MTVSTPQVGIPGLDVASETSPAGVVVIERMGANDWLAGLTGDGDAEAIRRASADQFEPVQALLQVPTANAALTRVELDVCGAWVTLSCLGTPQPVVVRRAGWIDFRGQLTPLPEGVELADDRVGLGPGDCIVLLGARLAAQVDETGDAFAAESLPSALLAAAGADSADQVVHIVQRALVDFNGAADVSPLLVLRVPLEAEEKSAQRVAAATGLAIDELKATRYPLGEQLMARRPAPPREARMQLTADAAVVSTVRELLKRLLASWRMAEAATKDVQLLASEVVGNAIRHGQSPVTLIARYDGKRVRVEVGDGSPELPALKHPSAFDEGGRGMLLVEAIARNWGVLATVGGKRVWFEVELGPEPR
jgi:anti-sigma regulatory factor (Ser/Thr protein kinase)